nr:LTA synthase family protein [Sedimentibacter sp.]
MDDFKKNIAYIVFFPITIIYFESVLRISLFNTLIGNGYLNMILFSIPIGLLMSLLITSFRERENKIILILLTILLSSIYIMQYIYYKIFSTFLSLYSFIAAGQAMQFWKVIINALSKDIYSFILLCLPLILVIVFNKKMRPIFSISRKLKIEIFGIAALIQIVIIGVVFNSNKGELSDRSLYSETFIIDKSVSNFGLLTTERLDCKNILSTFLEAKRKNNSDKYNKKGNAYAIGKVTTETGISEAIKNNDYYENEVSEDQTPKIEYNIMDIDFDDLIGNEQQIKDMNIYFSKIEPTEKNQYTGKFKDKNLILITAEGFSPYAIDKNLTPTLYRMYEEGFKFKDFYTPLWGVSTSDGEYVACTGLIPKAGVWSMYESSKNYMPFCLGNQMKNIGYNTFAYHDHYFDYYKRNSSHPNMGYTYKGLGNGLDIKETWPESDLEMIDVTVPEYIGKIPFHTYYMTVSGHLQYTFAGNAMSNKNKDAVKDLNYSDNVKAYLAANIEFDKAMESLINKLEVSGIADDTLIAISPDHYPYGLEISEISELAGHDVESNFELYKGVFLLWSKGIEPLIIDKPCSSLDILPTLSNLMGIEYDSKLLMGRDIMSNEEPLVIFSNRSWITDKATFNSSTGELKVKNDCILEDGYEEQISKIVADKFKYSSLILDKDYYGLIIK